MAKQGRIIRRVLAVCAASAVLGGWCIGGVPPAAAAAAREAAGLSPGDAGYYVDVQSSLPSTFTLESTDESAPTAGIPGTTSRSYRAVDDSELVMLHLAIGKGRAAQIVFDGLLEDPTQLRSVGEFTDQLAASGVPMDRVSVTSGTWAPAQVGDRATTNTFDIALDGEGAVHLEVVVAIVRKGSDAALVEVDHVVDGVPLVDVTALAGEVVSRVRNGPPSTRQRLTDAALIHLDDLPSGWSPKPGSDEGAADGGSAGGRGTSTTKSDFDGAAEFGKVPACARAIPMVSGATPTRTRADDEASPDIAERKFRSDGQLATSSVTVYPNESAARRMIDFVGARSTRACLVEVYEKAAVAGVRAAASDLSPAERKQLGHASVEFTRAPSSAGNHRATFTVTVDLRPVRDAKVVVKQEYVQVGRVVGLYTFGGIGGPTVGDEVIAKAVERVRGVPV